MMPSRFLLIMASSEEATIAAKDPLFLLLASACSYPGGGDLNILRCSRIRADVLDQSAKFAKAQLYACEALQYCRQGVKASLVVRSRLTRPSTLRPALHAAPKYPSPIPPRVDSCLAYP